MTTASRRPPPGARALLRAALPRDQREAVLADLDDEFAAHISPHRSRGSAWLWYWRQVVGSLAPAASMRRRRRAQARRVPREQRHHVAESLEQLAQDLRLTVRFLRKQPGFAAAAIATFALGIGANTAIFSIVDAVLLRPLPYADAARLVRIWSANPRGIPRNNMSPPDFFDLRDGAAASPAIDSLAAFTQGESATLTRDEPVRIVASSVTANLFATLGVKAAAGRTFVEEDGRGDGAAVILLSDAAWRRLFNGEPAVVGRQVAVDGTSYTIVGVMPPAFRFPSPDVDGWVPLGESLRRLSRSAHYLDVIGRIAPGATIDGARDVLQTLAARLETQYPATNKGWRVTVDGLRESVVGEVRRPLLVLLGAVCCVLLIACANVASLLLARGAARARELAVRSALGASRGRVLRQQLVESCLIALVGGAAGLAVASWSLDLLRSAAGFELPRLDEVSLDRRVLLVTLGMSLLTGLLTGIVPAWRSWRSVSGDALKSARTAGTTRAARRARSVLVVAEIALTLALLAAAGLLLRSFSRVISTDAGFQADHVLLAQVDLPTSYKREAWAAYFSRALDAIRSLPGVTVAGAGAPLPLSGQQGLLRFGLSIDGRPAPADGRSDRVYVRWATPGYFAAMGIPVLQGRAFSAADRADTLPVAIVDASFVRRHFPGEDPIGKRVRASNDRSWREVVGVVGSVRQTSLEQAAEPHLYVAEAQNPWPVMTFVVRTAGDPSALAGEVRDAVRRVDPALPVFNVRLLEDVVRGSVSARRFNALLLALFALLATALTIVGIYGVIAYWVSESAREIGVRIALGAGRGDILSLVVGRSLRLTAMGGALGIALALAAGRLLGGLLFGVTTSDPVAFAGAAAAVLITGLVSSYLPARRALAIDPAASLRAE